jgi:hypothetical protein
LSTSSPPVESHHVIPSTGYGTLEAPWLGWEAQLEKNGSAPRTLVLSPGFWGVSRPIRIRGDLKIVCDAKEEGPAWVLPSIGESEPPLEAIFLIDGMHRITIQGICFNGRRLRARAGIFLRCGTRIVLDKCRFGDFGDTKSAAVRIAGESEERFAREIVIQNCRFQNAARGVWLGRNATDLLLHENRFEEISGCSLLVDPQDIWTEYGLIFVRNRIRSSASHRESPHVRILPGAEGIRLAENTFEGAETGPRNDVMEPVAALEIRGGGPMSRRRLEVMLNHIVGSSGPGIAARQCGPGFLAAGNHLASCGTQGSAAMDLQACHGVLVEDNEISELEAWGIRVRDCASARINGNEVIGTREGKTPRGGAAGLLFEGEGCRRLRITDNRIRSMREEGIRVAAGRSLRVTGNEVEDCGVGIRIAGTRQFVLVGNDCRDNTGGGIRIDPSVSRGFVALNYAILNGSVDLDIHGDRVRCHSNKVDRRGSVEEKGSRIPA